MADYSQLMNLEKKRKGQPHPIVQSEPERPNGNKAASDLSYNQNTVQPLKSHPLSERANGRTNERPNDRRIITRNSFEIYEDQMDSLRKLAYHEKMQGKLGSMSAMVREAIDTYILSKTSK